MSLRSWLLATAIVALAAPAAGQAQPQPGAPPASSAPERPSPEQRAARQRHDLGQSQRAPVQPSSSRPQPGQGSIGGVRGQHEHKGPAAPTGEGVRLPPATPAPAPGTPGAIRRGGRTETERGGRDAGRPQIPPGLNVPAVRQPPISQPRGEGKRRFEHGREHPTPPATEARREPKSWPRLGDWRRDLRGPDADHAGRQWRDEHHGWDKNAIWRRRPNWWRYDRGFHLFFGPRIGFLFVPEIGYVAVPPQYEHGYWAPGGYLPQWFWRYEVRDFWRYGLPEPPPGCVWVWVDDDIALIDADTGYILDMVRNVW